MFDDAKISGARHPDRRTWIHISLLVVLTALVFSNTLDNEMHLDSVYRVQENPELDKVWPVLRHFTNPGTSTSIPQIAQYRPMLPLSLSINKGISKAIGLDSLAGYHLGNTAIHIAVCVMVYLLFVELLAHWSRPAVPRRQSLNLAFAGALLYALHPVAGVPVNYVCARDLLLMMLFLMGSLLVYARMRRASRMHWGWPVSLGLLGLSLLSKQNSVVAPVLILLFELLLVRSSVRSWRTWARPFAFAMVVAGFFVWTEGFLNFSDLSQLDPENAPSPLLYASTMARIHVTYYLRNVVWPFYLRPLPFIETAEGPFDPGVLAGATFVLATLALALYLRRRAPLASWSILAYWVLFAPTSSVRPFRIPAADYRQYASLAFLCLILVLLVNLLPKRSLAVGAFVVLFGYFGTSSFFMNRIWKSEESLWGHSVRHGATGLAKSNFALSISKKDPVVAEKYYLEAIREGAPIYASINLGLLYIDLGRGEEGLAQIQRAASWEPNWGVTHYWLSRAYQTLNDPERAALEIRRAADLEPENLTYQYEAAKALQLAGQMADSLLYLERTEDIRHNFNDTGFLMGWALQKLDRWDAAEARYREFLAQKPRHIQARMNLGYGLMQRSRYAEAIGEFEEVLRLAPDNLDARHNLGYTYRLSGQFALAITTLRAVLDRDPSRIATHYELASAYAAAGRLAEAEEGFREVLRLQPAHSAAQQKLAELERRG